MYSYMFEGNYNIIFVVKVIHINRILESGITETNLVLTILFLLLWVLNLVYPLAYSNFKLIPKRPFRIQLKIHR